MKNLDQIRASNAILASRQAIKGKDSGEVVKKVPPMIINDGLLGALAFACQQKDSNGYVLLFQAVVIHLQSLRLYPDTASTDIRKMAEWLSAQDSARLRALTAETLAYLSYLRRFASKEEQDADRNDTNG
ncbi:MAG: hypothetical protein GX564_13565 [Oligosphaeraceae bacterium]|nr:hypothetical protein [Oligosphaeraceae bacterium]